VCLEVEANTYWLWLVSIGTLILLMQAGFFLLAIVFKIIDVRSGARGMTAYPRLLTRSAVKVGPLHVLAAVRVADVMSEVPAISPLDALEAVQEIMFAREAFALPVLNENCELCGIISMSDILKIDRSQRAQVTVSAVYTREVQSAFPDQTMHEVVERMRERHLANFPVVSRRDEKQLLGMITKSDIVLAYRQIAVDQAV
jgi:CBS domain-containing protein